VIADDNDHGGWVTYRRQSPYWDRELTLVATSTLSDINTIIIQRGNGLGASRIIIGAQQRDDPFTDKAKVIIRKLISDIGIRAPFDSSGDHLYSSHIAQAKLIWKHCCSKFDIPIAIIPSVNSVLGIEHAIIVTSPSSSSSSSGPPPPAANNTDLVIEAGKASATASTPMALDTCSYCAASDSHRDRAAWRHDTSCPDSIE
jgi:hypothetical protein